LFFAAIHRNKSRRDELILKRRRGGDRLPQNKARASMSSANQEGKISWKNSFGAEKAHERCGPRMNG
jgi:hypothetical protein